MKGSFGKFRLSNDIQNIVENGITEPWVDYTEERLPLDRKGVDNFHIRESFEFDSQLNGDGLDVAILINDNKSPSGSNYAQRYNEAADHFVSPNEALYMDDIEEKGLDLLENNVNYNQLLIFEGDK
jgi:hypothetical protein